MLRTATAASLALMLLLGEVETMAALAAMPALDPNKTAA